MANINSCLILTILSILVIDATSQEVASNDVFATTTFRTNTLQSGDLGTDKEQTANSSNTARGMLNNLIGFNGSTMALDGIKDTFFKNLKFGRKFSPKDCLLCRFSASLVQYAVQTTRGKKKVQDIARTICVNARYESEDVCSSIAKLFTGEVTKVLAYALFTPDQICGLLSDNHCGHIYDPFADWTVSLEASEYIDLDMLHQYGIDEKLHQLDQKSKSQSSKYKVIHISDTHVDLNYAEGSISDCEEPLCCQATSAKATGNLNRLDNVLDDKGPTFKNIEFRTADKDGKAGHWGSYSNCDIPIRTFEQLLINLNDTIKKHHDIAYIIWTGDIQPHDVWKQSNETATKTFDAVFELVNEYLPEVKIFPTLGNHEMIPVDSFSPSNLWNIAEDDSPKWVYREFDKFWHKWLPRTVDSTILKDGNYAAIVRPGLKVISLNTNYCHDKNFWLFINSTDPGNQLQWLVHELQISELLQEKVHIIGHIPPGADDCLKVWSKNFNRIIRRYKHTVTAQFYGHTHYNEFEIFYDRQIQTNVSLATQNQSDYINAPLVPKSEPTKEELMEAASWTQVEPISVGFIGPSATTFIGLNPSYRIYTINPLQDFMPIDFDTYYLNLTTANEMVKRVTVTKTSHGKKNTKSFPLDAKHMEAFDDVIKLSWVHAGSFSHTFNIPDTTPESMHKLITSMSKKMFIKERVSDSLKSLMSRVSEEEDQRNHWKREPEKDDDLYKLYRLYNSYSDLFGPKQYAQCDSECRKLFLCRYLKGESHNSTLCIKYIQGGQESITV